MAKRRREIPVDFGILHDRSLFCCATEVLDCTGQDDTCIILAGITDTEDWSMPPAIEVDT
jgi:hypothetical protein